MICAVLVILAKALDGIDVVTHKIPVYFEGVIYSATRFVCDNSVRAF